MVGVNGTIEIQGRPGFDQVRVEAIRRVRSKTRHDAQAHLPHLQIAVSAGSDDILLETVQPKNSDGREYQVDYVVTVPQDFWADVVNANGSVNLKDLFANAWVQNANGDIFLKDLTGSSWVTLGNGKIEAQVHLPPAGRLVHSVGNGGVALTVQPEVSAIFGAQVGNGSISLTGLNLSQSVAGPHSLHGVLGDGSGAIELSVGNGWIQARGG
jgi:hypothetical protein